MIVLSVAHFKTSRKDFFECCKQTIFAWNKEIPSQEELKDAYLILGTINKVDIFQLVKVRAEDESNIDELVKKYLKGDY